MLGNNTPCVVARNDAWARFDACDLALDALLYDEPELMDSFSPLDPNFFEDPLDFLKKDLFMVRKRLTESNNRGR